MKGSNEDTWEADVDFLATIPMLHFPVSNPFFDLICTNLKKSKENSEIHGGNSYELKEMKENPEM